jgi:mutator protein MutT
MKSIPVAVAVIIEGSGKLLLTQRYDPESPAVHMKWQLPGGGIEKGEEASEACIREALEETGLLIQIIDPTPQIITKTYEDKKYVLYSFKANIVSGTINVEMDEETHDCRWFEREEIEKLDLMDDTMEMIDGLL